MRTQAELEQIIRNNYYREVNCWRGDDIFTIRLRGAVAYEATGWELSTPANLHYDDSLEGVVAQAEKDYPEIRQWYGMFRQV